MRFAAIGFRAAVSPSKTRTLALFCSMRPRSMRGRGFAQPLSAPTSWRGSEAFLRPLWFLYLAAEALSSLITA